MKSDKTDEQILDEEWSNVPYFDLMLYRKVALAAMSRVSSHPEVRDDDIVMYHLDGDKLVPMTRKKWNESCHESERL